MSDWLEWKPIVIANVRLHSSCALEPAVSRGRSDGIRKALIRIFLSEASAPFDAIAPRTLVIDPYGDLAIVMAACPSGK